MSGAFLLLAAFFPFVPSFDGATNVTDFSSLLEAPAGKNGFVRCAGERFATDLGDIRFNGVNTTSAACFPSREQADRTAARLARFGVNLVRLHYFDATTKNRWGAVEPCLFGTKPGFAPDPEMFEKLDYFVFALKRRGVYVNLNLHVGRKLGAAVGYPDTNTMQDKGCTIFDPQLVAQQKAFAKTLLHHVNPYTKTRYAEEPAVALVELNNEDGVLAMNMFTEFDRMGAAYKDELRRQYNAWLAKRYGRAFDRDIPLRVGAKPPTPEAERVDYQDFLYDVEERFFRDMYAYLRDTLGCRMPIGGTQVRFSPSLIQRQLDFTDNHDYWCHPKDFTRDAFGTYENTSSLKTLEVFRNMLGARVKGRPHTFSEYNQPFPNEYGAETLTLLHAYAAFQDWSAVCGYTYNRYAFHDDTWTKDWFNLAARTDVLAHLPACSAMYLRGDVATARRRVDVPFPAAKARELLKPYDYALYQTTENAGADLDLGFVHAVAIDYDAPATGDVGRASSPCQMENCPFRQPGRGRPGHEDAAFVSDTEELVWHPGEDAYWLCRTKGVKMFQGFVRGRSFGLGDGVTVKPGRTINDWCTVSLTRNGASMLLAVTGVSRNRGMTWREGCKTNGQECPFSEGKKDFVIEAGAYFDRNLKPNDRRLTNWGGEVTVNEAVVVELVVPGVTHVWALDESGERKASVPVADGRFTVGREETVWYELN